MKINRDLNRIQRAGKPTPLEIGVVIFIMLLICIAL